MNMEDQNIHPNRNTSKNGQSRLVKMDIIFLVIIDILVITSIIAVIQVVRSIPVFASMFEGISTNLSIFSRFAFYNRMLIHTIIIISIFVWLLMHLLAIRSIKLVMLSNSLFCFLYIIITVTLWQVGALSPILQLNKFVSENTPRTKYQIRCTCGWSTPPHLEEELAVAEGAFHEKMHPGHSCMAFPINSE